MTQPITQTEAENGLRNNLKKLTTRSSEGNRLMIP